jgi:Na+/melibiose symporter-like transporter
MDDIHRALLADVATPDERNGLSALAVGVEMVSQVAILLVGYLFWFDRVPDSAFAVAGGLMAGAILVTVLCLREPGPEAWAADRRSDSEAAGDESALTLAGAVASYRPALVLGLVMFFYWSGVNAAMPLVSVYVRDILHGTVGEAQLLPALLLLSTMLMALPMGTLGDRFGKRRVMGAGGAIIGCAALGGLIITTREQGAAVFLLAGVGSAAIMVLTVPLLSDLVPREHMGAATGALAASGSLAAPVAAVAAGVQSDVYGPRAIFALMAAMIAIALALLPWTRPSRTDSVVDPADPTVLPTPKEAPDVRASV